MRILVAEDDPSLSAAVTFALRGLNGFSVDCVRDGEAASFALREDVFDLVILDLGLPRIDGFELLRRVRARGFSTPVMVMSGRDAEQDKVRALDLGADDYIVKPFGVRELEARVRALLRRTRPASAPLFGERGLAYDAETGTASLDGMPLRLSCREAAVLEMLLKDFGKVVRKERLMAHLYTHDETPGPNAIEVFVHRLRKKLAGTPYTIATHHGVGYQLERREESCVPVLPGSPAPISSPG